MIDSINILSYSENIIEVISTVLIIIVMASKKNCLLLTFDSSNFFCIHITLILNCYSLTDTVFQ